MDNIYNVYRRDDIVELKRKLDLTNQNLAFLLELSNKNLSKTEFAQKVYNEIGEEKGSVYCNWFYYSIN